MEKSDIKKKKAMTNRELQEALLENFVSLQRVLANLSVKFDGLSDNISKLLQLFEISAKSFIKKQEEIGGKGEEKVMLDRLETLLEQNKTIARGLTLMEEKVRHRLYGDNLEQMKTKFPQNLPNQQKPIQKPTQNLEVEETPRPRPLPRI
jgi:hypothetical protein